MHDDLCHGFTWLELLAVLAIAGMLAGLAVPPMSDAVARYRLRATVEALHHSLQRGRTTAIRRGHEVEVCPSVGAPVCSPGRDWPSGWIVRDTVTAAVIERFDALDARIATTHGTHRGSVRFQTTGASPHRNQRITLCVPRRPASAMTIVVANGGHVHRGVPTSDEATACAARPSGKR